ncbi:MAG TPA: Crp/Fnr family transcriptional regulator [Rhodocyclaceae bacterium]
MSRDARFAQDLTALYPPLAEIDADLRQRIFDNAQTLTVAGGTVLFDEHQPCQGFPFVVKGSVRVVKAGANGRELPLYRVLPGETCVISSSCLLGRIDYNARGVADEETTVVLLPRPLFDELVGAPAFREYVFRLLAERIADLMQLIEEVAFRRLDQRLAALLLGKGRMLHTTHQHLADELGSVREIVSRLLKGFSEQGFVSLGREQIEILDPAGLRNLAQAGKPGH